MKNFKEIAASKNAFITTCFGRTFVFVENDELWIEYINEHDVTIQEQVTEMQLAEYCK